MSAASVNKRTLSDQVTHAIREAILTGAFEPGQRLSEPELAKWLDVSLTPVREALGALAGTGLVVRGGRQGTYVRVLGADDVENLLSVRESLEVLAVRQGVPNFSDRDDAHLRDIVDDQAVATDLAAEDPARALPRLATLNDAFHQRILERAGNSWLTSMLASIQDLLVFARVRLRMQASLERRRESLEEHRGIAAAIAARDLDAAERRMRDHIASLKRHVIPLVPDGGSEGGAAHDASTGGIPVVAAPFDADPRATTARAARPDPKGGEGGAKRSSDS